MALRNLSKIKFTMLVIVFCIFPLLIYINQESATYEEQAFDGLLFLGAGYFLLNFICNLLSGEFIFKGLSITKKKNKKTFYALTSIGFLVFVFFSTYLGIRVLNLN